MQSYTVPLGEIQLAVGEWPGGSGTIVGVNGILGNLDMLRPLGEALAPEFRFISYDLRGRGESSSGERSSLELHANDLLGLLSYLKVGPAVLVGHSMGAWIAAIAARMSSQIKGAVFLDGGGVMGQAQRGNIKPIFDRIGMIYDSEEAYLAAYRSVYQEKQMEWNESLQAYVRHDLGKVGPGQFRHKGHLNRIREDYESLLSFRPEAVYPAVHCPVLVVHAAGRPGDADILYPDARDLFGVTRRWLPQMEGMENEGHHLSVVLAPTTDLLGRLRGFARACLAN